MKIQYSPYLYTFDIETTTFNADGDNLTDVYLASFFKAYFNKNTSADEIEKNQNFIYCRSWLEIDNMLNIINSQAQKYNNIQIIYVHNLSYEFDGLIKNCDFVRDNFDNDKALFIRTRRPAFIRLKNIEFRCSFVLLNKALETLGKLLNYPKLEIDYKAKYFSFSELPDIEYTYNLRDVKLTMYAIFAECAKYKYIEKTEDIPLTFTSFTRKQNLYLNDKKTIRDFKNRNSVQKKFSREYINYLEEIYTGGYTHCSSYYAFKILQYIISVDITSSYPDSMLHRWYPFNFHPCGAGVDVFQWFKFMVSKNSDYNTVMNNYRKPFRYGFFATVTLKDVRIKRYNNTEIPVISVSKIVNDTYRAITDNGRLVRADTVVLQLTHVDYWLIQQFYDFELVHIEKLYYTSQFRPLSQFVINCVLQYADEKSVLKKACTASEQRHLNKEDFYCTRTGVYIYSDAEIDILLHLPDLRDELKKLLSDAKSKLNAQYGILVQRLYADSYRYLTESDEYEKYVDYKLPRDLYRNFEEGLFIPTYSRLNLFCFALFILKNSSADLVYSDTDSWKISGDNKTVMKLLNRYNYNHNKMVQSNQLYGIGQFDYEKTYDYFISGGCKKYITCNDNKISVTIAGIPKRETENAFNEFFRDGCLYDFNFFCKCAFKPNTLYKSSITEKLCSKYHKDDHFSGTVTDENGVSGQIDFNSMVELCDTDYVLLSTATPANKMYIKYLEYVQNRTIETAPTVIYRGSDGAVDYNYLSEISKEIITINEVME